MLSPLLGSKTPDVLKDKLREALRKGDKDALEEVLDECIAAGMPELDSDIRRARKALDEQEELDEHRRRGQIYCHLSRSLRHG